MKVFKSMSCLLLLYFGYIPIAKAQLIDMSLSYAQQSTLNPALTGFGYQDIAQLYYRQKGSVNQTMYRLMLAEYAHYFDKQHMALGCSLDNHQSYQGLLSQQKIAASYAYRLRINQNSYLQMALQAKLYQHSLHWQKLIFVDQFNDIGEITYPTAEQAPTEQTYIYPDFSSGMAMLWQEKWVVGVSVDHLTKPLNGFYKGEKKALDRHIRAHISTSISLFQARKSTFTVYINPHFIYQQRKKNKQIQLGVYLNTNTAVIGTWYRQNISRSKTLSIMFGLNYKNITFAYTYDMVLSTPYHVPLQSHAIGISYAVKHNKKRPNRQNNPMFPVPKF